MSTPLAHLSDRRAAGRLLGARLIPLGLRNPAVIALSPGGILVGFEIARALGGELELIAIPGDSPGARSPRVSSLEILHRVAVLVDDGASPTATILATIGELQREGTTEVVLAVPVLPVDSIPALECICGEVVYLVQIPDGERPEAQYDDFHDVSRSEASHFLRDLRDRHSPPAPPIDDDLVPSA
jgi:predicted phosphoribosyltransferase